MKSSYRPTNGLAAFPYNPCVDVGEDYALVAWEYYRNKHDGSVALIQHVSLSLHVEGIGNQHPILCGVFASTGSDIVFLHLETILELVRETHERLIAEIRKGRGQKELPLRLINATFGE